MDETLAEWLRLREAADAASRSAALTQAIVTTALPATGDVRVLDLATGTGSNIRYLIEALPPRQHWLAADRSPLLLAQLPVRTAAWARARGYEVHVDAAGCAVGGGRLACRVATRRLDLGPLDTGPDVAEMFTGRHLVTASALLDLVSESWLRALAGRCRAAGAAALLTLTYNGRSSCVPAEPEDRMVLELFNRHQQTDKGLGGPAAGPDAAESARRCFADAGYRVRSEPSDWRLTPQDREMQRQLIQGWADAATELAPEARATIEAWRSRRMAHVNADRSHIVVGHDDVAAWLPQEGGGPPRPLR